MKPDYEDNYHSISHAPCPWCGGHTWVDFYITHALCSGLRVLAHPRPGGRFAEVDYPFVSGESVSECVHCGAVVS